MVKRTRSIIAITFLFFLMGCELYLVPPRGREKPGDEDAQITGFRALQLGEDSVTAEFAWKPSRDYYDEYGRVDEVKLFMQKDKPYLFPVHFFDGDTLEGRSFDRQLGVYDYSAEWSGFSSGDEAWVTLYYRTEDGWRAPLYDRVKIKTPPDPPLSYPSIFTDFIISIRYDLDDPVEEDPVTYNISGELSASSQHRVALILFNELRNLDYVQSADFDAIINDLGTGVTTAKMAPLYSLRDDGQDIMEKIDESSSITIDLAALPVDIAPVVSRAVLYETYAIAIYPEVNSDIDVQIDAASEELTNITYYPTN